MANPAMNGPACFAKLRLHPNNFTARLTIRAAKLLMGVLDHSSPIIENRRRSKFGHRSNGTFSPDRH
jgi:hypothetical protein